MAEKVWLKNYADGVPAEADVRAYRSLKHMFVDAVERYRALPAFTSMGTTITYGKLESLSRDFAGYLQVDLKLAKGDRLAIMLPNVLQYPVAVFGSFLAGLTVVNVNPLYTARELKFQLLDSGASAVVVLDNFAHTVEEVHEQCSLRSVITTGLGDLLSPPMSCFTNLAVKYVKHMVPRWNIPNAVPLAKVLREHRGSRLREVDLGPDDVAFLQYTSGTTGSPKGAILTHGNVVANVRQNNVWSGTLVKDGAEVVVTPLPLYHILALTVNLLSYLNFGGHNVLIANPRDIKALVKTLKRSKFSVITGVNTLYKALLDEPAFGEVDTSRLKSAVAGGAAVQRAVADRWKAATGVPIVEGYGLTEASGVLACNPLDAKDWRSGVGVPYPSTEISIRDEAGKELPLGEIGEVCARGPQIMKGYWHRPDETAEAFFEDGWFRTGDVGYMDQEGWLKLVDRKKDVIVVSGFKAYPTEIEEVVVTHPDVLDAAAVGVPDEKSGEAVKLYVVPKGAGLQVESLMDYCRKNLAGYKCPRYVEFTSALPKTPIGKVMRRALRASEPRSYNVGSPG